jgi:hypothetical protein
MVVCRLPPICRRCFLPRTPVALRAAAAAGWRRKWCSIFSTAVQRAFATIALGGAWEAPLYAQAAEDAPSLTAVLALAPQEEGPGRMPLRVAT